MPNKYIRHGETFNGNGTSSAAATVDGGVGAWNSLNVFDSFAAPNYGGGSLAAGDVVYIRSKDAGGADIARQLTANMNLGSAAATYAARITWIIDGGTVWPGINGSIKYSSASSSFAVTLRTFNNLIAEHKAKFVVENTLVAANQAYLLTLSNSYVKNVKIDWSLATGFNGNKAILQNGGQSTVENLVIKAGKVHQTLVQFASGNAGLHLINPDIELGVTGTTTYVFGAGNASKLVVTGGRLYGAGATTGTFILQTASGANTQVELYGFVYPNTVLPVQTVAASTLFTGVGATYMYGADGVAATAAVHQWGTLETRQDDNYPTLSAFLPSSVNTPWAYKLYPSEARNGFGGFVLLSKIHTGDEAALNINLELLVSNTFAGLNASNMWISGSYINTSGIPEYFSTHDLAAGPLSTSTADWSSTTYGPITFLKRQINITTPSAVKKDTLVMLRFNCDARSASSSDIIFVNPDF